MRQMNAKQIEEVIAAALAEVDAEPMHQDTLAFVAARLTAALAAPASAEPEKDKLSEDELVEEVAATIAVRELLRAEMIWSQLNTRDQESYRGTAREVIRVMRRSEVLPTEPSEDERECPTCNGKGEWGLTGMPYKCHTCDGKGRMKVARDEDVLGPAPVSRDGEGDMHTDEAALVAVKKALSMFLTERQIVLTVGQMQSRGVLFRMRDRSEPGEAEREAVTMRRFHKSYPGMPDLWHTSCEDHPDWGTCAEKDQAEQDVDAHMKSEHSAPVSRDAELIVEAKEWIEAFEHDKQFIAAARIRRLVEHIEGRGK